MPDPDERQALPDRCGCAPGTSADCALHGPDAQYRELERLRAENERLRQAGLHAVEVLGANHVCEEGPNARWVEFPDGKDGYYEEDLVCRADCRVCAAKAAIRSALTSDDTEAR